MSSMKICQHLHNASLGALSNLLSDIQIKFTLTPEEPEEEPSSLAKQPPPETKIVIQELQSQKKD